MISYIKNAAIIFLLAGFLLTGCQAPETAPMPTEIPTEIPTKIPTATAAPTATVAIPPTATSVPAQAALPSEWNGIPVFPEAITAEESMGDLSMTTAAPSIKIIAYYKQKMPDFGWELDPSMMGGSDLAFVKDNVYAFFLITPLDGKNQVDVHLVKQD